MKFEHTASISCEDVSLWCLFFDFHQIKYGVQLRKSNQITPTYLTPNLQLSTGNLHVAEAFPVLFLRCKRHVNEWEEPTTSYR